MYMHNPFFGGGIMLTRRSFLKLVGQAGGIALLLLFAPIRRLLLRFKQNGEGASRAEDELNLDLERLNQEDTLFFAGTIIEVDVRKHQIRVRDEQGDSLVFLVDASSFLWKGGRVSLKDLAPQDAFFAQVYPTNAPDVFRIQYLWANIVNFYARVQTVDLSRRTLRVVVETPAGSRQVIVHWDANTLVNEQSGKSDESMRQLASRLPSSKRGVPVQVLGVAYNEKEVRATRIWFPVP